MDRVKSAVKQIEEQNLEEKPTANAIIAVIKSAIEVKMPALYQLIDLHDMGLETICKKLAKSLSAKKTVEIQLEHVAASFASDNHYG